MLESLQEQYPGIAKDGTRKEQGNQEKADQYRQELSSMMRPVAVSEKISYCSLRARQLK